MLKDLDYIVFVAKYCSPNNYELVEDVLLIIKWEELCGEYLARVKWKELVNIGSLQQFP